MALTKEQIAAMDKITNKGKLSQDKIDAMDKIANKTAIQKTTQTADFSDAKDKVIKGENIFSKIARGVEKFIGGGKLAEGIGYGIAGQESKKATEELTTRGIELHNQLMQQLKEARKQGDKNKVEKILGQLTEESNINTNITGEVVKEAPTTKEIVGSATRLVGTAVGGKLGANAVSLGTTGAIEGAGQALEENKDIIDVAKSTLVGAGTSIVMGKLFQKAGDVIAGAGDKLKNKALSIYKSAFNTTKRRATATLENKLEKFAPELLDEGVWGSAKKLAKIADEGLDLSKAKRSDFKKTGALDALVDGDNWNKVKKSISDKLKELTLPDGTIKVGSEEAYKEMSRLSDRLDSYKTWGDWDMLKQDLSKKLWGKGVIPMADDVSKYGARKDISDILRKQLADEYPTLAEVNAIYEKNKSLKDLINNTVAKAKSENKNKYNLFKNMMLPAIVGFGSYSQSGDIGTAIKNGALMFGAEKLMNSTLLKTGNAVMIKNIGNAFSKLSTDQLQNVLLEIGRYGAKLTMDDINGIIEKTTSNK